MQLLRPLVFVFIFVSLALYMYSLTEEVFSCPTKGFLGYEVLAYGWLGFITLDPRWITNILYFWMILKIFNVREVELYWWVPYLGITLAYASIPIPSMGCASSGGAANVSNNLAFGGYLWVASVSIICSIFITKTEKLISPNKE